MKKGFSMLRGILLALTLLFTLSACSSATETPTPSPENSSTPTASPTISPEELTALATYRPTIAPSFTPVTPSMTPIPSITYTPTPRPTSTLIPEEALCPDFSYGAYSQQGMVIGIQFEVPRNLNIKIEILSNETGELLDSTVRVDQERVILVFDPGVMPPMEYLWRASLEDGTRTGLCLIEGVFRIPDLNATATAQSAGESTAESTELLVPTATATARIRSTEETGR